GVQLMRGVEHKNEKQFEVVEAAVLASLVRPTIGKDFSAELVPVIGRLAALEKQSSDLHAALCDGFAALALQVRSLQVEVTAEVPSVGLVNAKLDAMRGLLRCTCAQYHETVKDQIFNAKAYTDDQIRRVPKSADLQLLWADCELLVDNGHAATEEFMSQVKDQILVKAAEELGGLVKVAVEQVRYHLVRDFHHIQNEVVLLRSLCGQVNELGEEHA
ncbi:unnamed protein product, partial [Prorocentrum cordatum]